MSLLVSCHSFRLFTGRQRANNLRPEFKDKLPDFVRRLEEALYRTARTKVGNGNGNALGCLLCSEVMQQCMPQGQELVVNMFCAYLGLRVYSQEEYTDISTLEARLQNVARRMIRPGAGGNQSQQPNPLQNLLAEAQPQQPTITVAQTNGGMIGVNGSNQFQQQQPQQQRSPLLMQQNPQNSVQISPGMVNVTSTGFDAGGTGLQHQQQNFPGTSQAGPSMQGPNQAMQQQNGNFVPNMNMTVRPGGVPANGLVRGQASRDMTQASNAQLY